MENRFSKLLKNKKQELILIVVVIAICAVFQSNNSVFLSMGNVASILSNNAVYGIMAIGMMLVISTGNIDVSVGGALAVISMVISQLILTGAITNPAAAILACMGMGLLIGLCNGLLVAKLKLPAIIVTLGTLNIMRGMLLIVIGSQWKAGLPEWFTAIARTMPFGLHLKVTAYAWIAVCFVMWFIMQYTILGRRILAAGSNPEASMRVGYSPATAYIVAFCFMGLLVGLGSMFYTATIGMAQPMAGIGYEMVLIAAVVIGGTSFAGGNISILGTFLGVLLLGIIENGMIITKVPVYWQELVRGIVLIAAIVFSTIKVSFRRRAKAQAAEGNT